MWAWPRREEDGRRRSAEAGTGCSQADLAGSAPGQGAAEAAALGEGRTGGTGQGAISSE